MNKDIQIIEKHLQEYINEYKSNKFKNQIELTNSMEYSLMAGGKRIRPRFVLEFNRACGGKDEEALPFACAIEMVHTYSLIHDDLPCMDDDNFRRGKPSNHIKFGESTALLAGDALQSMAFEIMSRSVTKENAYRAVKAINCLAYNCGTDGMVGGQVVDIALETMKNEDASLEVIKEMYKKKTSGLIVSACVMGAIIGGASEIQIKSANKYASNIGLAFQIVDDILDITSTTEKLGKPVLSDEKNNKNTLVSVVGIEKSKEEVTRLTDEAILQLSAFENNIDTLTEIANSLVNRDN